jgi:hypothetical protein
MAKHTPMNKASAARIQSSADKSGSNQGFKARAQSATAKKKKSFFIDPFTLLSWCYCVNET